jgi:hypothetical protein
VLVEFQAQHASLDLAVTAQALSACGTVCRGFAEARETLEHMLDAEQLSSWALSSQSPGKSFMTDMYGLYSQAQLDEAFAEEGLEVRQYDVSVAYRRDGTMDNQSGTFTSWSDDLVH